MVFRIIGVCSIVWVCGLSGFFVQGVIKSHQPTFLPRTPNTFQCLASFYQPRSGMVMQKCRSKIKRIKKKGTYGFFGVFGN